MASASTSRQGSNSNKQRILELDILRTVAILSLITYHIPLFTHSDFLTQSHYVFAFYLIGVAGLALFFFLSGYTLYLHNRIKTVADAGKFFRKRLVRIYPLYWLVLAGIMLTYRLTPAEILIYVAGLQALFYPAVIQVLNVHFITAILICYLIYPLASAFSGSDRKLLGVSLVLFIALLALKSVLGFTDDMVIVYLGLFIAGIFASKHDLYQRLKSTNKGRFLALSSAALIVMIPLFALTWHNTSLFLPNVVLLDILAMLMVLVLFTLAVLYVRRFGSALHTFFSVVGYSTYAIFLINMPVFNLLSRVLYNGFHISGPGMVAILTLTVPFLIIVGYVLQYAENKVVTKALDTIGWLKPERSHA